MIKENKDMIQTEQASAWHCLKNRQTNNILTNTQLLKEQHTIYLIILTT